jgi:nucleotide-binding universal stress UspA family protein
MKILIGYDGSESSDAMLRDLSRAGLPQKVEAVIVSVADVWLPPSAVPDEEMIEGAVIEQMTRKSREHAEQALEKKRTMAIAGSNYILSIFPDWQLRTMACAGSPAWEIIKISDEWRPDLIIVGCQGRSSLGRLWFGSVSQKIVTEALCSVRVARPHNEKDKEPLKIIVGVDGSADSIAAVRTVARREWPAGSEVKLITSLGQPFTASSGSPISEATLSETIHPSANFPQETRQILEDELQKAGLVASSLVCHTDPKHALLIEATKWSADSIFVGSRGLNRIKRLLLGSVSTAVVARAHCSVEVVRTRE